MGMATIALIFVGVNTISALFYSAFKLAEA